MIRQYLAAFFVCMGSGFGAAAQGGVHFEAGRPYSQIHAMLVRAGYRPFRILVPTSELYNRNIFNRDDVYRLYPDVLVCAGSGLGDCNFVLTRGNADIIVVHTTGEHANNLTFRDLRHVTQAQVGALYR